MNPAEQIAEARAALERTRQLLLDPTAANVSLCGSHLAAATANVQILHRILSVSPVADPGLKESAAKLRVDVLVVASLLDRAAAYRAGRLQSIIAASAADTPPSPYQMAHRVQLDG